MVVGGGERLLGGQKNGLAGVAGGWWLGWLVCWPLSGLQNNSGCSLLPKYV